METERQVVREGVVVGLIGAATVAVWFLLFDIFEGAPLQTPTVLWRGLIQGTATAGPVAPALGPVLGYTVVHVLAFVLFGIIAAWLGGGGRSQWRGGRPLLVSFPSLRGP